MSAENPTPDELLAIARRNVTPPPIDPNAPRPVPPRIEDEPIVANFLWLERAAGYPNLTPLPCRAYDGHGRQGKYAGWRVLSESVSDLDPVKDRMTRFTYFTVTYYLLPHDLSIVKVGVADRGQLVTYDGYPMTISWADLLSSRNAKDWGVLSRLEHYIQHLPKRLPTA